MVENGREHQSPRRPSISILNLFTRSVLLGLFKIFFSRSFSQDLFLKIFFSRSYSRPNILPGLFVYYFYGIFASQPPQLKTTDLTKVRLSDSCRSAISSWMENMSLQNVHPQTMQNVTGSRLPLVSAAFCPWCNIPTSRLD